VAPIFVAVAVPRRNHKSKIPSGGSRIEAMINPTNDLFLGAGSVVSNIFILRLFQPSTMQGSFEGDDNDRGSLTVGRRFDVNCSLLHGFSS
jgi:hypothetical protein